MNLSGLLTCAAYASPPNARHYCGPPENLSITQHVYEGKVDKEIKSILAEFETLYPYLQLISRLNSISDPFDSRVVEAYWIGNDLLHQIDPTLIDAFFDEKLHIKKNSGHKKKLSQLTRTSRFYPHHTFHVMHVFQTMKLRISQNIVDIIDNCRISWGQVIETPSDSLISNHSEISIKRRPFVFRNSSLILETEEKRLVHYPRTKLIGSLKKGDWVAVHWNTVCDVLQQKQVKQLIHFTKLALNAQQYTSL